MYATNAPSCRLLSGLLCPDEVVSRLEVFIFVQFITIIVSDECVTASLGRAHTCTLSHNVWTVVVCHHVRISSCVFGWVSVCPETL